jgi:hypothetical protein
MIHQVAGRRPSTGDRRRPARHRGGRHRLRRARVLPGNGRRAGGPDGRALLPAVRGRDARERVRARLRPGARCMVVAGVGRGPLRAAAAKEPPRADVRIGERSGVSAVRQAPKSRLPEGPVLEDRRVPRAHGGGRGRDRARAAARLGRGSRVGDESAEARRKTPVEAVQVHHLVRRRHSASDRYRSLDLQAAGSPRDSRITTLWGPHQSRPKGRVPPAPPSEVRCELPVSAVRCSSAPIRWEAGVVAGAKPGSGSHPVAIATGRSACGRRLGRSGAPQEFPQHPLRGVEGRPHQAGAEGHPGHAEGGEAREG